MILKRLKSRPILKFTYESPDNELTQISVVMPIFNQALIIHDVLDCLTKCMTLSYELIIIDDASEDSTLEIVIKTIKALIERNTNCKSVRVYSFNSSVFETKCDSFGISVSKSKYILEIQADMFIYERGFDRKLVRAAETYSDVLMISGRGVEQLMPISRAFVSSKGSNLRDGDSLRRYIGKRFRNQFQRALNFKSRQVLNEVPSKFDFSGIPTDKYVLPSKIEFLTLGYTGRLGMSINECYSDTSLRERSLYIGETVMRGPLLIRKDAYEFIGGFNTEGFFLGYDDHDLSARALKFGFRVGFVPIGFQSPLFLGSSRKVRTIATEFQILRHLIRIRKNYHNTDLAALCNMFAEKLVNPEIRAF